MPIATEHPYRAGLTHLSTESRLIPTPWARMVRGVGLGQHPTGYDPATAADIRDAFARLTTKVNGADAYTACCSLIAELILTAIEHGDVQQALVPVLDSVRAQDNPYHRLMAGCILVDALAKLDLDASLLINDELDFPAELLATIAQIEPDQIKDENRGHHGDYERVCAAAALFLALGQLGLTDRLSTSGHNYLQEALDLLENIPSPFYRGRGGAILLTVVALLGQQQLVHGGNRDYIKEILDHLDRADELEQPVFPQPMTIASARVYPLLTMLNAIAAAGTAEHLRYGKDRLAEAETLMAELTTPERCHMSLYYIVALHNLGRPVPDLDGYLADIVARCERDVDPGADFFLNGISYPYIIETATIAGRSDLISDAMVDRFVRSFPDLDRTPQDRVHRTFPLSYGLNALGGLGCADRLFRPNERYQGDSPLGWVIDQFSDGARDEGIRLSLLNHALVNHALRLRGAGRGETPLFQGFHFPYS
jgi:hypothetical protein